MKRCQFLTFWFGLPQGWKVFRVECNLYSFWQRMFGLINPVPHRRFWSIKLPHFCMLAKRRRNRQPKQIMAIISRAGTAPKKIYFWGLRLRPKQMYYQSAQRKYPNSDAEWRRKGIRDVVHAALSRVGDWGTNVETSWGNLPKKLFWSTSYLPQTSFCCFRRCYETGRPIQRRTIGGTLQRTLSEARAHPFVAENHKKLGDKCWGEQLGIPSKEPFSVAPDICFRRWYGNSRHERWVPKKIFWSNQRTAKRLGHKL